MILCVQQAGQEAALQGPVRGGEGAASAGGGGGRQTRPRD